jgi:hypothetical protein
MSVLEAEVPREAPKEILSADIPPDSGKQKQARERSSIEFPYLSLDIAMEIAKAVHTTGGSHAGVDQVAAHMGEAANGGAFRNKVVTSRIFGLVTYSNQKITLTNLGSRLADPDQEKTAKADAFLHVPLYRRLYEDYTGSVLPPTNTGLEAAIVGLGVSPKQKDKARQAFQRSAALAGFFAYGTTKLIYPALGAEPKPPVKIKIDDPEEKPKVKEGNGGNGGGGDLHPFIQGLLRELPQSHTDWPLEGRKKWLQSALSIFDLIYQSSDGDRPLVVGFEKSSAK